MQIRRQRFFSKNFSQLIGGKPFFSATELHTGMYLAGKLLRVIHEPMVDSESSTPSCNATR